MKPIMWMALALCAPLKAQVIYQNARADIVVERFEFENSPFLNRCHLVIGD